MRCNGVRCSSAGRTFRRSDETPELSGLRRVESRERQRGQRGERREIYPIRPRAPRSRSPDRTGTPTPADRVVAGIYVRKTELRPHHNVPRSAETRGDAPDDAPRRRPGGDTEPDTPQCFRRGTDTPPSHVQFLVRAARNGSGGDGVGGGREKRSPFGRRTFAGRR